MPRTDLIRPIAETKKLSDFFIDLLTSDLTDEQSNQRVREPEGASIVWHLGHLCHARCELLTVVGEEVNNTFEPLFERRISATDGTNYPGISAMRKSWEDLAEHVSDVLENVTTEQLFVSLEGMGQPHGEKNVLGVVSYVMWHEVYHIGQIGTVRTLLGLPSTFDRMVETSAPGD